MIWRAREERENEGIEWRDWKRYPAPRRLLRVCEEQFADLSCWKGGCRKVWEMRVEAADFSPRRHLGRCVCIGLYDMSSRDV